MGTYLEIRAGRLPEEVLLHLNNDWIDRTKDLLLLSDENNGHTQMEHVFRLLTNADMKDWAKGTLNNPAELKRMGLSPDATIKQTVISLRDRYPTATVIGSCDIKLSGSHYCYHMLARIKTFLEMYKADLTVHGFNDLVRYLRYYEMVDTTNYCSICKDLASNVGLALPLPDGPRSPDIQSKLDKINTLKDFI